MQVCFYIGNQEIAMTPKQVVDHFKTRTKAAKAIGVSYEAVRQWVKSGQIPELRQHHIQNVTNGVLVADDKPDQAA